MQEVFEKIIERIEEKADSIYEDKTKGPKFVMLGDARKVIDEVAEEHNNGWIPVEERLPEKDRYVLVSISNYPMVDIGRYDEDEEGGAFYHGDDDKSYASYGLFVNAWQPLPEPYVEGGGIDGLD